MRKGAWLKVVVLQFVLGLLFAPLASATHASELLFDPTICGSDENVVFTLLINNTGNTIVEVEVLMPPGFRDPVVLSIPGGWSWEILENSLFFKAGENAGIPSGGSEEFEFQALSPIVEAAEIYENWRISTIDNTEFAENHVVEVKVDNRPPSITITTSPPTLPAGNSWLVVTADEMLQSLDNVYLAIENSAIENEEERELWTNLIRIQGPIDMSTNDRITWKGVLSIPENLEDYHPRVLVLPESIVDLAGNQIENATVKPISVDTRPPILIEVSDLPDETNQSKLVVSGFAADQTPQGLVFLEGLEIRVTTPLGFVFGETSLDGSFEIEAELVVGTNLLAVGVFDEAGNTSHENLQTVALDNSPPVIQNFRLMKDGTLLTSENNAEIEEARPEILVDLYDFWMGVKTAGMSLEREGENLELLVEFENNVLKGIPAEDLEPGTYVVAVSVSDGLTGPLNQVAKWWVFSYGALVEEVESPPSAPAPSVVLPPPQELQVSGFPENFSAESTTPGKSFSMIFGPYSAAVHEVEIVFLENRENLKLLLEILEHPRVPFPENLAVSSCFEISVDAPENSIEQARLVMIVEKNWLKENVLENTLALYRFVDNQWTRIQLTETRENKTHVLFLAESKGLGLFVLAGSPLPKPTPPEALPFAPSVLLVTCVLAFLAALGGAWVFRKSRVKSPTSSKAKRW